MICGGCEREFETIGKHWAQSSCGYPPLSPSVVETAIGVFLGDGCAKNSCLTVTMTNRAYLTLLDDIFGPLSHGVSMRNTVGEQKAQAISSGFGTETSKFSDVYVLRISPHPLFRELQTWSDEGGKRLLIELTPTIARHWYVCDGSLRYRDRADRRESIEISSVGYLSQYEQRFREEGFSPTVESQRLSFGVEDTVKFFEWIGEPMSAFEYKWPNWYDGERH